MHTANDPIFIPGCYVNSEENDWLQTNLHLVC